MVIYYFFIKEKRPQPGEPDSKAPDQTSLVGNSYHHERTPVAAKPPETLLL
jgi:hypothetical protein